MARGNRRKCKCCQKLFRPDPSNRCHQRYCSAPRCRRASKSASQARWLSKPANQGYFRDPWHVARVRAWRSRNPGYWRAYRDTHPAYADRNRAQQPMRNARRPSPPIAKMDVSTPLSLFRSGLYRLQPLSAPMIAKMGVWIVEILSHSDTCADPTCDCKEMTC